MPNDLKASPHESCPEQRYKKTVAELATVGEPVLTPRPRLLNIRGSNRRSPAQAMEISIATAASTALTAPATQLVASSERLSIRIAPPSTRITFQSKWQPARAVQCLSQSISNLAPLQSAVDTPVCMACSCRSWPWVASVVSRVYRILDMIGRHPFTNAQGFFFLHPSDALTDHVNDCDE